MVIESYLLSEFTTSSGVVNASSLSEEIINDVNIPVQLDGVTVLFASVEIEFQDVLTAPQKLVLDSLVSAHSGLPSTSGLANDGSTLVTLAASVGGNIGPLHLETIPEASISNSWTTIIEKITNGVLYEFIWKLNSNDVNIQIIINDTDILTLDIGDIEDVFRLGKDSSSILYEYNSKRWIFRPPVPIQFDSLEINFNKENGNKKFEAGMLIWKEVLI